MLDYILNGLASGAGYALVGVGLSYTIGVTRVFNFAYGVFYMLGAMLVAILMGDAGVPYVLAILVMLVVVGVVSIVFARVAVLPLMAKDESSVMLATFAAGVLVTNLALWLFGSEVHFIDSPLNAWRFDTGTATVSAQTIVALIAVVVLTASVTSFMKRTSLGARIRAVAQNPGLASATGVNTPAMILIAVVVGVLFAAVAGALYGPSTVVNVFSGDTMLLKAFAIAALAGMGQLWGAAAVGVVIGISENLFGGYIAGSYTDAFTFGLLLAALMFFPGGVFNGGRR